MKRYCGNCGEKLRPEEYHHTTEECLDALKEEIERLKGPCSRCGSTKIGCLICAVKNAAKEEVERRIPGLSKGIKILGDFFKDEEGTT